MVQWLKALAAMRVYEFKTLTSFRDTESRLSDPSCLGLLHCYNYSMPSYSQYLKDDSSPNIQT